MRRSLIIAAIAALVSVFIFGFFFFKGKGLKQFEHLKNPRISEKPSQKMLIVKLKGEPNSMAFFAYKNLFSLYYKLPGVPKMPRAVSVRARYYGDENTPADEWHVTYGITVPGSLNSLPDKKDINIPGFEPEIESWDYGLIAEILHIGSYNDEKDSINKLKNYIADSGYEICGPHEEDYVSGPGMFLKGDPKHYYTIIRYQVCSVKNKPAAK